MHRRRRAIRPSPCEEPLRASATPKGVGHLVRQDCSSQRSHSHCVTTKRRRRRDVLALIECHPVTNPHGQRVSRTVHHVGMRAGVVVGDSIAAMYSCIALRSLPPQYLATSVDVHRQRYVADHHLGATDVRTPGVNDDDRFPAHAHHRRESCRHESVHAIQSRNRAVQRDDIAVWCADRQVRCAERRNRSLVRADRCAVMASGVG